MLPRMRGAIAAGHPLTAEAGARVLAAGGNAVDACVAAAFVSWVTESPLTGPGGGGFMLVHTARDGRSRVFDFFVSVPAAAATRVAEMETVGVDFEGGESSQLFRIGAASVAVPGAAPGLEQAHRAYGSLPWAELLGPAIELARGGVALTRAQAYLHAILDVILRHFPEGRAVFGESGRLGHGDRLLMTDLAGTLERLARNGSRELTHGDTAHTIASWVRSQGGLLALRDLQEFRVVRRRPIVAPYRGHEFRSNPPPSSGGVLVGYGLRRLDGHGARFGSAEALAALAETMEAQTRAREGRFLSDLYRGGLAKRLLSGTSHISVIDRNGDAASLSASLGSGSGVVVPGTGVHLNNMLGEDDLAGSARPGTRLTSMMAPSVVLRDGLPRLVVGSAGSARLRGAILQVVVNVMAHGLGVEQAIVAPRVHFEAPTLHVEGGADPAELDRLAALGWELVRWRGRNLYFGGVSAVERFADGSLAAAGDPRRGGHGIVVE
jgi:gamma-glutamyltranspeptidase/glutathione hydrolase